MSAKKKAKCEKTMSIMTVDKASSEQEHWFPLENSPCVMNSFIANMGFDTSLYDLTDVLSIEPWALKMIPQLVTAVMTLYPLTDVQKEYHQNEQVTPTPNNVWFIQEHIENACRTIRLLHALLNAPEGVRTVTICQDSWLHSLPGLSSGYVSCCQS